eukprot:TRINITY_DN19592_c0_g3_i1.p1 TRINITY_DN19592_c0_g3~~TRINITY_DN19592_c0_g3_i1.p1  ORF type:complete len:370 (-),score=38.15 TRINITY_DN19592_c0_g3_i1:291-1400(-)
MDSSSSMLTIAPSTPTSGQLTSRCASPVTSPAKQRRLRYRALAEARERQRCESKHEETERTALRKLREDVSHLQRVVETQRQELVDAENKRKNDLARVEDKLRTLAQDLEMPKETHDVYKCPRCTASIQSSAESCWCFELFCSRCDKLSMFCTCRSPVLASKVCDACGYQEPCCGIRLETLDMHGFQLDGQCGDDQQNGTPCDKCGEGHYQLILSRLDDRDVCGSCHGVENQGQIVPCSSVCCVGDEEAMFHEYCMRNVLKDIFQCLPCVESRQPLEHDSEEDETDQESDDHEVKQVQQHGNICVGMPSCNGVVQDIYPHMDKVCVRVELARGGCEVQHLKLSKISQKMEGLQAQAPVMQPRTALDLMD